MILLHGFIKNPENALRMNLKRQKEEKAICKKR